MVTTESLVDSVMSKWLPLNFPIQASPSLGFSSGSLTAFHRAVIFPPTWGELAGKIAAGGDETTGLREAVALIPKAERNP